MEECDIAREASRYRGTPTQQIADALLVEIESARPKRTPMQALAIAAKKRCLATEFGIARGWRLSRASFGLMALKRGAVYSVLQNNADVVEDHMPHEFFDHPYLYRVDRKAVAVAAHLYNFDKAACDDFAKSHGLRLDVPDFPSWWYPGATTLVVFIGRVSRA